MASNEDIIKEADYYLQNDVTIAGASSDLGISKRTLQLHLEKLKEIAPIKYALVIEKKKANELRGKVKGGSIGKRSATWTPEQANEVAQTIIDDNLTYEEAANNLGIPKSTLHEMVHKGINDPNKSSLLYAIAEAHRKHTTMEEYQRQHSSKHVVSDLIAKEIVENKINDEGNKLK